MAGVKRREEERRATARSTPRRARAASLDFRPVDEAEIEVDPGRKEAVLGTPTSGSPAYRRRPRRFPGRPTGTPGGLTSADQIAGALGLALALVRKPTVRARVRSARLAADPRSKPPKPNPGRGRFEVD